MAQVLLTDKTLDVRNLLGAANQQTLTMLDRADEFRCLQKAIMSPGIEPGIAAAKLDDAKFAKLKVATIDIGDLELAASGRPQASRNIEHAIVVEVEAGNRPVGQVLLRLLYDVDGLVALAELDDSVLAGLVDEIGEDGCPGRTRGGLGKLGAQPMTIEHIVAKNERHAIPSH